jgi:hypothetical protein
MWKNNAKLIKEWLFLKQKLWNLGIQKHLLQPKLHFLNISLVCVAEGSYKMCKIIILSFHTLPEKYCRFCQKRMLFKQKPVKLGK